MHTRRRFSSDKLERLFVIFHLWYLSNCMQLELELSSRKLTYQAYHFNLAGYRIIAEPLGTSRFEFSVFFSGYLPFVPSLFLFTYLCLTRFALFSIFDLVTGEVWVASLSSFSIGGMLFTKLTANSIIITYVVSPPELGRGESCCSDFFTKNALIRSRLNLRKPFAFRRATYLICRTWRIR